MYVYRCDLILHDYLFFATTERGKVAESGAFIHNYALTYALGWAQSPWRNDIQQAHYPEELAQAWQQETAYVTPAYLMYGASRISQYNTMGEGFKLGKKPSAAYPDWGFVKCWRPDTHFRFFVLSREAKTFPRYMRLGKFMSKAELHVVAAQNLKPTSGTCESAALLAWDDLKTKPVVFDLIATSVPTRLIRFASFTEVSYVQTEFFDEEVCMPLEMGYLVTPDKAAQRLFGKCPQCKEAMVFLGQTLCNSL